jgi:pimeloyl-ACP methyl ester carboxylesterase
VVAFVSHPSPARAEVSRLAESSRLANSSPLAEFSSLAEVSPLADCVEGQQAGGATYRICMPTTWNGDLVVYAHGYVAPNRPLGIPEDQLVLPGGARIDEFVTTLGYAFATTGYSANGLAVIPAQAELVELVDIFTGQKGRANTVLLVGVSEGGLIATLLAERRPSVFDGALALCGPYGDFARQVDYVGDFRVLFDYYFPGVVPPSPIDVPDDLLATWETSVYSATVKPLVEDPANSAKVAELLKVGGVAYDNADPATRERSIERVLWYNIYATDDATVKLGGQPFNNQQPLRTYTGSTDDAALNRDVQRFSAAPPARAAIEADYQTNGNLVLPLVTLHTRLDPVVPFWHQEAYTARVAAAGKSGLYLALPSNGYGHCAFGQLELLDAFGRLSNLIRQAVKPQVYLPVVSTGSGL